MSEHASPTAAQDDSITRASGLEAFRSSPEFSGVVEEVGDHHCNDHFAQIHETDEERFATAVPFVRHGLEQGERVMYIVEEDREPEVRAALRDGGIDVDAMVDADQLSFHTPEETYLRNDSFDPDDMVEFYEVAVTAAAADHEALRIVGETTWLDADVIPFEEFMEYEAKVNQLFDTEDCLALCQYDRNEFSPEFIQKIVESHPHLIYDGAACHNAYYTPPAEIFDDTPARKVNRMLGTLHDRATAKSQLQQRDQFLQTLYKIAASQNQSFEEKLHAVFDLGCEHFDFEFGFLNRVDPAADHLEVEYASGNHEHYEVGAELPLSETYCKAAVDIKAAKNITDPTGEGYDDLLVYDEFGVDGYLGTYIPVTGGIDRTLAFVPAADADSVSVSERDRMHIELMGQWIGYELNRRQRERFLRKCYEITSDPGRGFEQKLDDLFAHGCEFFDMELGAMARVNPETDQFEIERISHDHEYFEPGLELELSETYCTAATDVDGPASVVNPEQEGYGDITVRQEFGLQSYLGTYLSPATDVDRTFFFVSSEARGREVSEAERTFLDLMGQWVRYELEHNHREAQLQQKNDRLENFASMLAHELRNPVTIGQIYGQQLSTEPDEETVEYVQEAFDRMENIIDVMLVLTRGRKAVDECTTVKIAEMAQDAWSAVDAPEAVLNVTTTQTIHGDETYLNHLFRNLLENAVEHGSTSNRPSADDAVEHGGHDVTVEVGGLTDGSGFYVADDGRGIPVEDRDSVFDEGYTTTPDSGGSGLGLAFVRKLADVYEWECRVTESDAGGARFEFRNVR